MTGDLRTLLVIWLVASALAIAVVVVARGAEAVMRRCAYAGLHVPPLLKRWIVFYFVWTRDGTLFFESPGERQVMPFQEISQIEYHYHDVVGFVSFFEFVGRKGHRVLVDKEVEGVENDLLPALESVLPNFRRAAIDECIRNGDVEDSCVIWKAAQHP